MHCIRDFLRLFCRQIHTSSQNRVGRNLLGQLDFELHLGSSGLFQSFAFHGFHHRHSKSKGAGIGTNYFQFIADMEFVAQTAGGKTVLITAFHNGAYLPFPDVTGIFRILAGEAVIETGGINAVRNMIHLIAPYGIHFTTGNNVINSMAVSAGDDGSIVSGLSTAFDLDAVDARVHQILQMINGAHIFDNMALRGSQQNDVFFNHEGRIDTRTNHSGGIQGGISNGQDIYFRVAFKPVATLLMEQHTVDKDGNDTTLKAKGRHDPCVLPRAVPIVEAMAAMTILDYYLINRTTRL